MARYAIARSKPAKRGNVYSGEKATMEWEIDPYYGEHDTNVSAKRAFIESWLPDVKGQSDERIKMHFDAQRNNVGLAKVVRVTAV